MIYQELEFNDQVSNIISFHIKFISVEGRCSWGPCCLVWLLHFELTLSPQPKMMTSPDLGVFSPHSPLFAWIASWDASSNTFIPQSRLFYIPQVALNVNLNLYFEYRSPELRLRFPTCISEVVIIQPSSSAACWEGSSIELRDLPCI